MIIIISLVVDVFVVFQTLKGIRTENVLLKAKNGRLQDENISKSKKIEELLSPDTQVLNICMSGKKILST